MDDSVTREIRVAVEAVIESIAPGTDLRALRSDRPLREQVDLDSMDWVNLLEALGERLGVDVPEAEYGRFTTLDAIVERVGQLRARGASGAAARATPGRGVPQRSTLTGPDDRLPPPAYCLVRGTRVTVRPLRRDDLALEAAFLGALSSETRYRRFMATVPAVSRAKLAALTDIDQVREVALAAIVQAGDDEVIVGVVRYSLDAERASCEFAVTLADAWQRTGLAGILMRALVDLARRRGVRTMEGFVLAANSPMLKLARQLGFRQEAEAGSLETVRVVKTL